MKTLTFIVKVDVAPGTKPTAVRDAIEKALDPFLQAAWKPGSVLPGAVVQEVK